MLSVFISTGTLAQWLTVAAVLGAAWIFYKGGGGTALQTLQTANTVLEHRVHELEKQVRNDAAVILDLRARTDVGAAVQPVAVAMDKHEARAQERSEKMLAVLDLIAARLGPDADYRETAR